MGERGAGADVREGVTGWRAAHAFALVARGFWSGPTRGRAWFLSSALAGCVLLGIAANVVIATWHRWFFDALEVRRASGLWQAAAVFPAIVAVTAAIQVGVILSRETIQVRWREWLTGALVDRWLARERFYRLTLGERGSNPEYRIADDVRMAIDPLIDFAIGLLNASVSALTFIGILWGVGGGLAVGGLWIPAYMVLAALLYGTLASAATLWIGRTLPRRVAEKNEAEARFRFALMRLRENAEAVALLGGAEDERRAAHRRLAELVARWRAVVWQSGRLTWIVNGNAVLVPVVPLLLTTPKYLAGELTLGAVMQLATAFVQVQMAIAWLVENWRALANWLASARRVVELTDAFEASPPAAAPTGRPTPRRGPVLAIERLALEDACGRPILRVEGLRLEPGEQLLLVGPSGSGKSTLVRALAGLWPWGSGSVRLAETARTVIVPSRTYLPLGSLREGLLYPAAAAPPPAPASTGSWSFVASPISRASSTGSSVGTGCSRPASCSDSASPARFCAPPTSWSSTRRSPRSTAPRRRPSSACCARSCPARPSSSSPSGPTSPRSSTAWPGSSPRARVRSCASSRRRRARPWFENPSSP